MTLETNRLGIYTYNGNDDEEYFTGIRLASFAEDIVINSYSYNMDELHIVTPELSMWVYTR